MAKAAVHQLVKSLGAPASGLPEGEHSTDKYSSELGTWLKNSIQVFSAVEVSLLIINLIAAT
jgi:hypothetical protein